VHPTEERPPVKETVVGPKKFIKTRPPALPFIQPKRRTQRTTPNVKSASSNTSLVVDGTGPPPISQLAPPTAATQRLTQMVSPLNRHNIAALTITPAPKSSLASRVTTTAALPVTSRGDVTAKHNTMATLGACATRVTPAAPLRAITQTSAAGQLPDFSDENAMKDLRMKYTLAANSVNKILKLTENRAQGLLHINGVLPADIELLDSERMADGAAVYAALLDMSELAKHIASRLYGHNRIEWVSGDYVLDVMTDFSHPQHRAYKPVHAQLDRFKKVVKNNFSLNENWASAYAEIEESEKPST
jgi:hypothetical protein